MEKDFLQEFINQATKKMKPKLLRKKEKTFPELGRKGGLKTKENKKLDKVISIRMTNSEYEKLKNKKNIR
jgi:hypothetical protein